MPIPHFLRMRVNRVDRLSFPVPDSRCEISALNGEATIHVGERKMVGRRVGRRQYQGAYFDGENQFTLTFHSQGSRRRIECTVYKDRSGQGQTHAGSWTADEDGDD